MSTQRGTTVQGDHRSAHTPESATGPCTERLCAGQQMTYGNHGIRTDMSVSRLHKVGSLQHVSQKLSECMKTWN